MLQPSFPDQGHRAGPEQGLRDRGRPDPEDDRVFWEDAFHGQAAQEDEGRGQEGAHLLLVHLDAGAHRGVPQVPAVQVREDRRVH